MTIKKGNDFEEKVRQILFQKYKTNFKEVAIKIGNPPKEHKFDLVSEDKKIIVECKDNSWSKTNLVPCGKLATINQAVLYFLKAPTDIKKIIVLRKYYNPIKKETLAQYYVRTFGNLLEDLIVMGLDLESMKLEQLYPSKTIL